MSRLDSLLLIAANLAYCYNTAKQQDWVGEATYLREALAAERERTGHLEERVAELTTNRDKWLRAYEDLREERAMAKKPVPPPSKGKPMPPPPGKPPKKPPKGY